MKYIRTKDGRILKIFCESTSMLEETVAYKENWLKEHRKEVEL